MNSKNKVGRRALAAVALVVTLGAVVALAQVALELTPGSAGGSSWTDAYKPPAVAEAEGEFVVVGAGSPTLEARFAELVYPGPYDGSPDDGPARLTP